MAKERFFEIKEGSMMMNGNIGRFIVLSFPKYNKNYSEHKTSCYTDCISLTERKSEKKDNLT